MQPAKFLIFLCSRPGSVHQSSYDILDCGTKWGWGQGLGAWGFSFCHCSRVWWGSLVGSWVPCQDLLTGQCSLCGLSLFICEIRVLGKVTHWRPSRTWPLWPRCWAHWEAHDVSQGMGSNMVRWAWPPFTFCHYKAFFLWASTRHGMAPWKNFWEGVGDRARSRLRPIPFLGLSPFVWVTKRPTDEALSSSNLVDQGSLGQPSPCLSWMGFRKHPLRMDWSRVCVQILHEWFLLSAPYRGAGGWLREQMPGESFSSSSPSGRGCHLNLNIISNEFIIKNDKLERRHVSYDFEFASF